MLETSGNAGKWTGSRYVLVLNVTLYIYSFPGLECKEGIGACPRPRKDVEDNLIGTGTHDVPALHRLFEMRNMENLEHKSLIEDGPAVTRMENYLAKGLQRSRGTLSQTVVV